jgi:hypothetical protein
METFIVIETKNSMFLKLFPPKYLPYLYTYMYVYYTKSHISNFVITKIGSYFLNLPLRKIAHTKVNEALVIKTKQYRYIKW